MHFGLLRVDPWEHKFSLHFSDQISDKTIQKLISAAVSVKENAYCPYSNFRVGSAVLCEDGSIFTGKSNNVQTGHNTKNFINAAAKAKINLNIFSV